MSKPATAAGKRRAAARASAKAAGTRRAKPPSPNTARAKAAKANQSKAAKPSQAKRAKPARAKSTKATRAGAQRARRAKAARARSRALLTAIQPRRLAALACLPAVLAAFYLGWLRDSSLVAVHDVEIKGVTSGDQKRITGTLAAAALGMTTLHLREDELEAAVASFPTVESVSADRSFPHGVTIHVTERKPTLLVRAGPRAVPADAEGRLLSGAKLKREVAKTLPVLEVGDAPRFGRLEDKKLEVALVVGAAPGPLRPLIKSVGWSSQGVEVTMRRGIPITFASSARARAKWAAAAAILADRKLDTLSHLDVRVPERPAVGGAG